MGDAAPAARSGVMARFFVPTSSISHGRGIIRGDELDHLRRVLRLKPGDSIEIFDEQGREHEAAIRAFSAEHADIEILRSYEARRESPLNVTLAVGLTKGEKMDFVVEKATELGAHAVAPLLSAHTVPKIDERKSAKREERWKKIALSAAKQCGRSRVPEILGICGYNEFVARPAADTLKLLLWENEPQQTFRDVHAQESAVRSVILAIGPEGGFASEEAELARRHGYRWISLGKRILRAETAAVAALALAQYLWGDLAQPGRELLAYRASGGGRQKGDVE
jgi:16S rRNA (uracil1498-N3)-methyltransferase